MRNFTRVLVARTGPCKGTRPNLMPRSKQNALYEEESPRRDGGYWKIAPAAPGRYPLSAAPVASRYQLRIAARSAGSMKLRFAGGMACVSPACT